MREVVFGEAQDAVPGRPERALARQVLASRPLAILAQIARRLNTRSEQDRHNCVTHLVTES
jgi:hypothetical protein